jgi:hypothetical protein
VSQAVPRLPAAVLLALLAAGPGSRTEGAIRALGADPSLKVRAQAAVVLGQLGEPAAVPALRGAVARDREAAVRLAAVAALSRLGARAARPTLRLASEADPDEAVRRAAARALSGLGPVTLAVEPPAGTPSAAPAAAAALERHLRRLGFALDGAGELRLRPTVWVEVTRADRAADVAARATLVVADGDGHLDLYQGSARATGLAAPTEARLASTAERVVDAAFRELCEELAGRQARR